jgi:hypothetical protein
MGYFSPNHLPLEGTGSYPNLLGYNRWPLVPGAQDPDRTSPANQMMVVVALFWWRRWGKTVGNRSSWCHEGAFIARPVVESHTRHAGPLRLGGEVTGGTWGGGTRGRTMISSRWATCGVVGAGWSQEVGLAQNEFKLKNFSRGWIL